MAEKKERRYVSDNAQLMYEWDWELNTDIKPTQLTLGSHKKVWWKCGNGHVWQAVIADRNNGNKCPYCSGKRVLKGYNDLRTVNPCLIKEWNYEKNGEEIPENYTSNSHKKVWWICKDGHEWQATIAHRNRGRGCPYCSGRKTLKGLVLLHFLSKKRQYDGQIALGYAAWYGLGRTFIEGLRMDSLYWGPFRVSQVLAGVSCIAASAVLIYQAFRPHRPEDMQAARMNAQQPPQPEEENADN